MEAASAATVTPAASRDAGPAAPDHLQPVRGEDREGHQGWQEVASSRIGERVWKVRIAISQAAAAATSQRPRTSSPRPCAPGEDAQHADGGEQPQPRRRDREHLAQDGRPIVEPRRILDHVADARMPV